MTRQDGQRGKRFQAPFNHLIPRQMKFLLEMFINKLNKMKNNSSKVLRRQAEWQQGSKGRKKEAKEKRKDEKSVLEKNMYL